MLIPRRAIFFPDCFNGNHLIIGVAKTLYRFSELPRNDCSWHGQPAGLAYFTHAACTSGSLAFSTIYALYRNKTLT
ncbi:MAG TPA: hypothetical protein DCW33_02180 [Proteobacteria bacterium]|nr:hypothetical protein [Pseudomonadota bacterium]